VWLVLGVVALAFELTGVKAVTRRLGLERNHDSLSAVVWRLPTAVRVLVAAALLDVGVHFVAHTPLIPVG
jgi:hypothetical protein